MLKSKAHLLLILAAGFAAPVLAQADPTVQQIYEAAQSGHLDQAQQMMNQVLRDHPQSAKAHYVAAELYAREGNLPSARQELTRAESLEPGLAFARADSVERLHRELAGGQSTSGLSHSASARYSFPWGWVLILFGALAVLWAIVRRRAAASAYQQFPGGAMASAGGPAYGPVPGPGYGPGYGAPGIGSGIAGGLATGLAVGAGVVAGEELAQRFLGDRRGDSILPPGEPDQSVQNGDMGGSDFGVSDAGSWDDGSVGGDVGGGDWT